MNVPSAIWRKVFSRDKGICRYCGEDMLASLSSYFSATVDHKIPRSAGGDDDPRNLVCCCPACNSMLSRARDIHDFRKRKAIVLKKRAEEQEGFDSWRTELGWPRKRSRN